MNHPEVRQNEYADMECAGCMSGEDCYGWTTETLKCPSRIPFDREEAAFLDSLREHEEETGFGAVLA